MNHTMYAVIRIGVHVSAKRISKSTCISKDARLVDYAYNGLSILLCDRDFLGSSSITDEVKSGRPSETIIRNERSRSCLNKIIRDNGMKKDGEKLRPRKSRKRRFFSPPRAVNDRNEMRFENSSVELTFRQRGVNYRKGQTLSGKEFRFAACFTG